MDEGSDESAMAICVYCGEVASTSREHIISASVLDLFGDKRLESCFVYDVLGEEYRSRRGIIIKDVCATCNSTLSRLDDRGKQIVTKVVSSELETLEENLDARLLAWLIKTHLNWLRQAKLSAGIDFYIDRGIYEHIMVAANFNIATFRRWSFAHLFYRFRDLNFLYPWINQGVGATKQRLNPVSYELLFIKESRILVSCLFFARTAPCALVA